MKKIKYVFYIVLIIIIAIAIWTIYKTGENNAEAKTNYTKQKISKNITIGFIKYNTLNPILTTSKEIQYLSKLIYEPLINITQDFKTSNGIADEWSKLTNTSYIIKLNSNKYWHDGSKVKANDVKFTIENLKMLDTVYKNNVSKIAKVEIIDDYTIKIFLTEEVPFFEYLLCFPILEEDKYISGTLESKTENLIGSGKYKYNIVENEKIELQNIDNGKIITIKIYDNNEKLYKAFSNNEIDIIITENYNYQRYMGKIGYEEERIVGRTFWYLIANIDDEFVKKSVNYAINRKDIIYNVFNDKYFEATFPLEYGSYLAKEKRSIFNKEQAKNILYENDYIYSNGKLKIKNLNLSINSSDEEQKLMSEIIEKNLTELGMKVNIQNLSDYEYKRRLKNKYYDFIIANTILNILPNIDEFIETNSETEYELTQVNNTSNEEILANSYKILEEYYFNKSSYIGICFNSIIILHNQETLGDFTGNWYNIFYNIDTWYKNVK